jgi:hypothetical protein
MDDMPKVEQKSEDVLTDKAIELLRSEPRLGKAVELARERLKATEVWVFGSRARGDHRPDSDWDLFVLVPDDLPENDFNPMVSWQIGHDAGLVADVIADCETFTRDSFDTTNTLAYNLPREGVRVG